MIVKVFLLIFAVVLLVSLPPFLCAQSQNREETAPQALPDAPTPVVTPQADSRQSQYQKAEEQLKEEERQRILGIFPAFNISYRQDAESLTSGQKMRLAVRTAVDPVTVAGAFLVAGYLETSHDASGFGWGAQGYGKRAGAAYLDVLDSNILSGGILPSIFRQDPRYFRSGRGSLMRRTLYSLGTTVIARHDRTRKWEPNYSNIGGNIATGALSNLYYPSGDTGVGHAFSNGLIVTAEGSIGNIFQEFWPDISRKLFHRDPTRGLDRKSAEKVEKPERTSPVPR